MWLALLGLTFFFVLLLLRLRRSEERYKLIAHNTSDLVCLYDPDGTRLWVSPSVVRILGYRPKELIGESIFETCHPHDRDWLENDLHPSAFLGSPSVRSTYRVRKKSGSYIWMEMLTTAVHGRNGEVLRLQTSSRNVTDRMEAEDLYRFLVRNLPNTSVFLFDHNYRHLVAEGTLLHQTLHPDLQMERRTLWEVLPDDIAGILAPYYKMVFEGQARSLIETFRTRTYECHFLPVRRSGGDVRAGLAVFLDVTEKRQRVRELEERSADLERSNRDLEQFANVASHELKSPLRRIASFVGLMTEELSRPNDFQEYVDHIVEGVEALDSVLDSLLVYSRVQTDPERFDWLDSNEVFDTAMRNLAGSIRGSGATITKGQLPEMLAADATLLRQLFENLVGNAIKFNTTGRRPEVTVTAKRLLLDWEFEVKDNGPGLDPGFQQKVFTMFQRLRPDVEGTGIGLALCKKIVGIHRGRIWFEPHEEGPGVSFKFTLPARTPQETTEHGDFPIR